MPDPVHLLVGIVRTEREADAIRRYIAENPEPWHHRADAADGHRI